MIETDIVPPLDKLQSIHHVFINHFKSTIDGQVILPGEAEYEASRQVHNRVYSGHPVMIVRPSHADDVVKTVHFAADRGFSVAVRGGGHSNAGYGTIDDGVVIDLSRMRSVTIDSQAQVAHAQAGITAGEFTEATIREGFAVPFGDSPSVGVAGITLGGGEGWLSRKWGLTIDSLLSAEIVTADGNKLHVSADEHPDLFWAIRGGGGNFGIVTSFEFKLHPVGTVLGGTMIFPPTREIMGDVIRLSLQAPDDLTTISMLTRTPPMPGVPDDLVGQLAFIVNPVWLGEVEAGERVIADFRALIKPLYDDVRPMAFSEMYEINEGAAQPYTSIVRAMMADELDDNALEAMLDFMDEEHLPSTSSPTVVQIRVLGGAVARVPEDATAFAYRKANLIVSIGTLGFPMKDLPAYQQWVESSFEAIRYAATGAYVNFLENEGSARVREAYPEATYQRLAEIKRRYDPDNFFHVNENIPPAK